MAQSREESLEDQKFFLHRFGPFTINAKCPLEQKKRVDSNSRVFFALALILLITIPLFLIPLFIGIETTIIFRNDQVNGVGIRIGRPLEEEEFPKNPFPIFKNDSTLFYAGRDNITEIKVWFIGFYIMDESLIELFISNNTLYQSLFLSSALFLNTTFLFGVNALQKQNNSNDLLSTIEGDPNITSPIRPFLVNSKLIFVFGNLVGDGPLNADVRFKFSVGNYLIPIFFLQVNVKGINQTIAIPGSWNERRDNLEISQLNRGLFEIQIDKIFFNATNMLIYLDGDLSEIFQLEEGPISFQGGIKKIFNLREIFTSVSEYSTENAIPFFD